MLPYYPEPTAHLWHWRITAFAICALAALLAARWIVLRRARRFGIGYEQIAPLYLTAIVAGLAGAIALGIRNGTGLSSLGAVAGGLAGAIAYCGVRRLTWARAVALVDVTAFAAPFAGAIGRLGCTLAHDHRGLPSHGWLAFHFPEGSRYDLGFIELLFLVGLCGVFVLLDRKPRPPLLFLGTAGCAYGAFRLWRETLDVTSSFLPWAALAAIGVVALALAYWRGVENYQRPKWCQPEPITTPTPPTTGGA